MTDRLVLPSPVRRAFDRMAADVARVLDRRLLAVLATDRTSAIVFGGPLMPGDLDALGALVEAWHKDGLETPLFLTPEEFRRSLDTFPLEYQAILDRHVVIAGEPPFDGVSVQADHLRRACEVQAKGHLIHLRQGWLEAAGHDDELSALLVRSAAPLRALLANVARLQHTGLSAGDAALAGAGLAGLPEKLVQDILALEEAPDRAGALVPALPAYLSASEQLWTFVDSWRSS